MTCSGVWCRDGNNTTFIYCHELDPRVFAFHSMGVNYGKFNLYSFAALITNKAVSQFSVCCRSGDSAP